MAINERIRLSPSTHCPVDVVFDHGEVVRFAGLAEAGEFLDFLENTPPEHRGSNCRQGVRWRENRGRRIAHEEI